MEEVVKDYLIRYLRNNDFVASREIFSLKDNYTDKDIVDIVNGIKDYSGGKMQKFINSFLHYGRVSPNLESYIAPLARGYLDWNEINYNPRREGSREHVVRLLRHYGYYVTEDLSSVDVMIRGDSVIRQSCSPVLKCVSKDDSYDYSFYSNIRTYNLGRIRKELYSFSDKSLRAVVGSKFIEINIEFSDLLGIKESSLSFLNYKVISNYSAIWRKV